MRLDDYQTFYSTANFKYQIKHELIKPKEHAFDFMSFDKLSETEDCVVFFTSQLSSVFFFSPRLIIQCIIINILTMLLSYVYDEHFKLTEENV